jgi:hypothetical protein
VVIVTIKSGNCRLDKISLCHEFIFDFTLISLLSSLCFTRFTPPFVFYFYSTHTLLATDCSHSSRVSLFSLDKKLWYQLIILSNWLTVQDEEKDLTCFIEWRLVYIANHYNRNQINKQPTFDSPINVVNKQTINQM